ncbi:MAG: hypothetical protein INR69_04060 [Mucilaginibacter polytrichastri]|nr:hypothetical protein [Mucilaginibacter polytrichastri]
MRFFFAILFIGISSLAFGQQSERPIVQFSGIVKNADSSEVVVPYVSIINITQNKQVAAANFKGYFSFVVREGDVIRFTSLGYRGVEVKIPDGVTNKSLTAEIKLKPETQNLPIVRIFPWATTDEFKKEFLALKIADDDLAQAKKNLNKDRIYALTTILERDGKEIQSMMFQQQHNNLLNRSTLQQTNPLLNPFAWGALVKQIMDGDKSRASD